MEFGTNEKSKRDAIKDDNAGVQRNQPNNESNNGRSTSHNHRRAVDMLKILSSTRSESSCGNSVRDSESSSTIVSNKHREHKFSKKSKKDKRNKHKQA